MAEHQIYLLSAWLLFVLFVILLRPRYVRLRTRKKELPEDTFIPDLAACTYFGRFDPPKRLKAIGWLHCEHPFTRGSTKWEYRKKLSVLLEDPWQPGVFLGVHTCNLCFVGFGAVSESLNLFVPGRNCIYVAPAMIAHYIMRHRYAPPQEFWNAVMECPQMGSSEYKLQLIEHGPGSSEWNDTVLGFQSKES